MKHDIDEILARRVAGETLADIRTVRRALRGERIRGVIGQRIREALAGANPCHSPPHEAA